MKGLTYLNIGENHAKASTLALPVSTKHCIEICRWIKHKNVAAAKKMLEDVIEYRQAVPFKHFYHNIGHRKGRMAAGRYPIKACKVVLQLIKAAEANASLKGLNLNNLFIALIIPNKGAKNIRPGRIHGRAAKNTHLQVVVEEQKESKKNAAVKSPIKKGG